MQPPKVCLVIIFNHRYDENINKLETLYQDRFIKIVFLMPFYEGKQENVIPVYECSYQFPGFLIQAYEKLCHIDADYYFFIGDDLILSPYINENNVLEQLKMEEKKVFINDMQPLNSRGRFQWEHARFSSRPFFNKSTQWKESIPGYNEALIKFENFFGTKYEEEYGTDFFECNFCEDNLSKKYEEIGNFLKRNGNGRKIPYPMAFGYSDIFMIKKEKLFPIARLCGVFSAMNLFAEISLPTSIVLSVERQDVVLLYNTGYRANVNWGEEQRSTIEGMYAYNLDAIYEKWEDEDLYIHPIKLSKFF